MKKKKRVTFRAFHTYASTFHIQDETISKEFPCASVFVRVSVCVCVCVCVCVRACVHACVFFCMYRHACVRRGGYFQVQDLIKFSINTEVPKDKQSWKI